MNNQPNAKKEDTKEIYGPCKSTIQATYYNVILRHVRVNIFAVQKQDVLHILSIFTYFCLACPAWKSQSPYYIVICVLSGSTVIFRIIS